MGKHHILTSGHAPKQVPEVMDVAHHDSADLCAIDVKEIAYTSTIELDLSHHESRYILYLHSFIIV